MRHLTHRHCPINSSLETRVNHIIILYWNEEDRETPSTDKLSAAGRQNARLVDTIVSGASQRPDARRTVGLQH